MLTGQPTPDSGKNGGRDERGKMDGAVRHLPIYGVETGIGQSPNDQCDRLSFKWQSNILFLKYVL